jgi:hypothetical protein
MADAFTIMAPEIVSVIPNSGQAEAEIEISGRYFGSKKPKVYLGTQKCKVISWTMNSLTGASQASFMVPKKLTSGIYDITVTNKVGSDTLAKWFTIP